MKIFIYIDSLGLGKGGAEYISSALANEMDNRGHEVYLGWKGPELPKYDVNDNVILKVRESSLAEYKKIILSVNPDVFFVFYFNRDLLSFYSMIHETGIPFGIQECTNPERLVKNNWKSESIEKARWERELVASAASMIRLVMPGYELSFPKYIRQNVKAFPNLSLPINSLDNEVIRDADRKRIINMGGLKQNKNLMVLLSAFSTLSKEFKDWDIFIYGKFPNDKNPYHKRIINYIRQNNLDKRVMIAGPIDNISQEYLKADIHVIASLSEGCPTCVLEAMAHKIPSVGIRSCHGTNKLIEDGKNGFLVENDEQGNGLRSALRKLMVNDELRRQFGESAYNKSQDFHPKEIYDQWENLFLKMLEYKTNPKKLFERQKLVDYERALHMSRSRACFFNSEEETI